MVSRQYPSYLFRDPLLANQRMVNTRVATPITLTNNININVDGDHLLNLYITKLDEEIYEDMPLGLGKLGEAVWKSDDWKNLSVKIADESRKHGWCVVQFYDEDSLERWRVFTVVEFTDYIKETIKGEDGVDKLKAVGMKLAWGDYLGNAFTEEVKFDDKMTFLVKFREGDGRSVFAFPDLTQAIMTLAFEFRQAKGQMLFSAAKPSFLHFIYGGGATEPAIDELDNKIKGVDAASAIGISKEVLEKIDTIENKNIAIIEPALNKQLQYFAGLTRLPISYYLAEKESKGMSDVGEKVELLRIRQKKETLFKHYAPHIITIFEELYEIIIDKLELPPDATLQAIEGAEKKKDDGGLDTPISENEDQEVDTNDNNQ